MSYLLCKKCGGYYQLEEGESLDDFDSCECGGELELVENIEVQNNELPTQEKDETSKYITGTNDISYCPECGTKTKNESEFCKKCGTSLTKTSSKKSKSIICSKCKTINPSGAVYCSECQEKLKKQPKDWIIIDDSVLNKRNYVLITVFLVIYLGLTIYFSYSDYFSIIPLVAILLLISIPYSALIVYMLGNTANGYIKNGLIGLVLTLPFLIVFSWIFSALFMPFSSLSINIILLMISMLFPFLGGLIGNFIKKSKKINPKTQDIKITHNKTSKKNLLLSLSSISCLILLLGIGLSSPIIWMIYTDDISGLEYTLVNGTSSSEKIQAISVLASYTRGTSQEINIRQLITIGYIINETRELPEHTPYVNDNQYIEPDPNVRAAAVDELGIINLHYNNLRLSKKIVTYLINTLETDSSVKVRLSAVESLSNIFLWEYDSLNYKNNEIIQALQTAAENDPNSEVRKKAYIHAIWAESYN